MKLKFKASFFIFLILILCLASPVYAEDTAGNFFEFNAEVAIPTNVDRDAYGAANEISLSEGTVGRSLLAAGNMVTIDNSTVNDSLRLLGNEININNVTVDNNITIIANATNISDSTANAAYIFGNTISFNGKANYVGIYGGNVTVGGEINGNVEIYGDTVTIEDNTVITGTLITHSPKLLNMGNNVNIGDYDTELIEQSQTTFFDRFMGVLTSVISTILIGLCIVLFFDASVKKNTRIVSEHPILIIATGFLGIIGIPIVFFILLFFNVTTTISVVALALYGITFPVAVAYTGVCMARLLLPNIGKWYQWVMGTAVIGLLSQIPFVSFVVILFSYIFTFGYILIALYKNMRHSIDGK